LALPIVQRGGKMYAAGESPWAGRKPVRLASQLREPVERDHLRHGCVVPNRADVCIVQSGPNAEMLPPRTQI